MDTALFLIFYLGFPALTIVVSRKVEAVNRVGAVVVCYVAGIAAGNLGTIPAGASAVQEALSKASIPLAKACGIDTDTMIITSVAGIIGWVIGTYSGIGLSYLLRGVP